uniref:Uncharacterized protein n=1 Tax=Chromera velia CCMP2878 TaxID=1169474 RepID=A0A0G4GC77_9ALVE|eukprot:Cvel_4469.t1-p1 / transcript=Cvel_4469.t1 / gene=Cvel_4469 / organism=Chromera_velia_CCMP2878 / gene_product=hypothetical protein / transcript_product=hypothetical protein / location=Cvel_scaffold195:59605-62263(-) / protein_length=471 / sequence_SO=supercontig / SO=protein_coding / is_pseudo=false
MAKRRVTQFHRSLLLVLVVNLICWPLFGWLGALAVDSLIAIQLATGMRWQAGVVRSSRLAEIVEHLHLQRRIQHAFSGLAIIVVFLFVGRAGRVMGSFVAWVFMFCLTQLRLKFPAVNKWYVSNFGNILRRHERFAAPGAQHFLLGTCLSAVFFSYSVLILAVGFLSFGDPVAAIVGITWKGLTKSRQEVEESVKHRRRMEVEPDDAEEAGDKREGEVEMPPCQGGTRATETRVHDDACKGAIHRLQNEQGECENAHLNPPVPQLDTDTGGKEKGEEGKVNEKGGHKEKQRPLVSFLHGKSLVGFLGCAFVCFLVTMVVLFAPYGIRKLASTCFSDPEMASLSSSPLTIQTCRLLGPVLPGSPSRQMDQEGTQSPVLVLGDCGGDGRAGMIEISLVLLFATACGVCGAVAEGVEFRGVDDNLSLPVVAGALLECLIGLISILGNNVVCKELASCHVAFWCKGFDDWKQGRL